MREGQELLEKREAFERWEDVVNIGLQARALLEVKLLVYEALSYWCVFMLLVYEV